MPLPIARPFKGVIPPLVTPLTARDEIEKDGLARVVERMIAAGVSGVFALGDFFLSRIGTSSDPFTSKVEGNKWQINGKALHGVTLEEVWERVENASGKKE
jgi:hypothetical protein